MTIHAEARADARALVTAYRSGDFDIVGKLLTKLTESSTTAGTALGELAFIISMLVDEMSTVVEVEADDFWRQRAQIGAWIDSSDEEP